MNRIFLYIIILFSLIITGCTESETQQNIGYDQTKKMVIDILQTEDGKNALKEILADEKVKQQLIMESEVIKRSITETLHSEESAMMWKRMFDDPEFVKSYAEALDDEQQDLFKRLMHDATYQKQMLELLQNPEIIEQTLTLMKSQQFREHLEETIQQTLESPLFQAKIQEIMKKASKNESSNETKSSEDQEEASAEEDTDQSEDDGTEPKEE